jgi:hypothetical protein
MGKGDTPRPRQISDEEWELRWQFLQGQWLGTDEEFNKRIQEIRIRTGKPR